MKLIASMARLCMLALFLCSCSANEGILRSGRETPAQSNAGPVKDQFARELEEFRTADFTFIYVLRRKDGGPIDAEDRGVIRLQTADANRRVSADDGKAFIIGTNAQLPPQNIMALYARFSVEDYSPASQPVANVNAASNQNK